MKPTLGRALIEKGIFSQSHISFWRKLADKFRAGASDEPIDWEAMLMEADLGLPLALRLAGLIEKEGYERRFEEGSELLRHELEKLVKTPPPIPVGMKPEVILLIGVNGSGKTTTAAKLAHLAQKREKRAMFAACDTFRAAAVDQLEAWAERLGVPLAKGNEGQDPASVAYQAYEQAKAGRFDQLIVDTAGRQANKHNLMQELAKIKRALGKQNEKAPHHTWLVVDANTGNNIAIQATEFHKGVGLTGLIMTKIEGSGKGGMVAAVREELKLPTYYLGRGEQPGDLEPLDAPKFVQEFFGS
jgi:fused signal recognition particle receptor